MGTGVTRDYSLRFFQLILRGRRPGALIEGEDDWRALDDIVLRMLFWCGGRVHGYRCEGNEMQFAVEPASSTIGTMAQHISSAYAVRLRRTRGWRGRTFKHYIASPLLDESLLEDLVAWLRRPIDEGAAHRQLIWTREGVLRHRDAYTVEADVAALFSRPTSRRKYTDSAGVSIDRRRPSPESVARLVAGYYGVSFDEMRSASRKRSTSKARVVAAVLCVRNGASAAAVSRLFRRSRSTLTARVEHYRRTEPGLFAEAERALAESLDRADSERGE
jgi:Bacterial dnaA protein helix-turn-helix